MIHPSYFQNILGRREYYHSQAHNSRYQQDRNGGNQVQSSPIVLQLADGAEIEINMSFRMRKPSNRFGKEGGELRRRSELKGEPQPDRFQTYNIQVRGSVIEQVVEYESAKDRISYSTPLKQVDSQKQQDTAATVKYLRGIKKTQSYNFAQPIKKPNTPLQRSQSLFKQRPSQYSLNPQQIHQFKPPTYDSKLGSIVNGDMLIMQSKSSQIFTQPPRRRGISLTRTKQQIVQNDYKI